MRSYVQNEHGVDGYWSHCGTMFGSYMTDADGQKRFRAALPLFVPRVCAECSHFDVGEYGDYGNLLSGPYCLKNIWFPVRKGTWPICRPRSQQLDDMAGAGVNAVSAPAVSASAAACARTDAGSEPTHLGSRQQKAPDPRERTRGGEWNSSE